MLCVFLYVRYSYIYIHTVYSIDLMYIDSYVMCMYILSNITLFSCPEPGWWLPFGANEHFWVTNKYFASSRRRNLIRMGRCQHLVRSSSAESTFGGSFEHGSHVPVVCWKDFKKLFDKQALRKLGFNFGTMWTSFPRVDPGILRGHIQDHPSLTCWLNGSTAWVANFWMEKSLEYINRFCCSYTP